MVKYNSEDSDLNDFIYCSEVMCERPSKLVIAANFKTKEFIDLFKDVKYINTLTEASEDVEGFLINEKSLVQLKENVFMSFTHMDKLMEGLITNINIYYKTESYTDIEKYISDLQSITLKPEVEEIKITCANLTPNGLDLEPMELMLADYDNIESFVNDDTFKSISKLSKKINKLEKGLSIIYGKRGSGKTTILNWIASKSNKSVIFIPLSTIDATINNPNFKAHLMKNDGSLLIIDDCEIFNSDMHIKSNIVFANILQMVDGFNSDDLMVSILLSFNLETEEEIDVDILECNNLIDVIKFDSLKKSKANKLCKQLGINYKVSEPILLNDLIKQRFEETKVNIGYI
jgi:hypothetical protein